MSRSRLGRARKPVRRAAQIASGVRTTPANSATRAGRTPGARFLATSARKSQLKKSFGLAALGSETAISDSKRVLVEHIGPRAPAVTRGSPFGRSEAEKLVAAGTDEVGVSKLPEAWAPPCV